MFMNFDKEKWRTRKEKEADTSGKIARNLL